ncbi:MAG: thiolase family protein [Nitrospirota bacterium]|nr:thiolase family protein [Nitrospirota bacterium]
MRKVMIAEGVRTPFTKAGSLQAEARTVDLGRYVVAELLVRAGIDPARVDELVAGNVIQPVDAVNVARVIALRAHVPNGVPAYTVHRNCASGIQALAEGWMMISSGRADCVVCVGVESMSDAPFLVKRPVRGWLTELQKKKSVAAKVGHLKKLPVKDIFPDVGLILGLTDPVSTLNMGQTAEKLAREFAISRADQDRVAMTSNLRVAAAWEEGRLADEVMTTFPPPAYEPVARDNGFRADSSLEKLASLKPVFDRANGTVTAGNSSQITDGACAVLLTSEEFAAANGLKPLGAMVDFAFGGLDPSRMGLGPVYATHKIFSKHGMGWDKVDLVELNEAFAAQAIACLRAWDSAEFYKREMGGGSPPGAPEWDRINVNGGAIALGHPVGATGTRIVLTLMRELRRRGGTTGIATLCIGGGQGATVLVEAAK